MTTIMKQLFRRLRRQSMPQIADVQIALQQDSVLSAPIVIDGLPTSLRAWDLASKTDGCDVLALRRMCFLDGMSLHAFDFHLNNEVMPRTATRAAVSDLLLEANVDTKDLVHNAISTNNSWLAYLLSRDVRGVPVNDLQRVVMNSHNLHHIHLFGADVPEADVKSLQQAIVDSGDPYAAYQFAYDIPGADIFALSRMVDCNWRIVL